MKKFLYLTLAVLFIVTAVNKVEAETNKKAFGFAPKFYIGLGAGTYPLTHEAVGIRIKDSAFGGFIKFGVDLNKFFATELRYGTADYAREDFPAGTNFTSGNLTVTNLVPLTLEIKPEHILSYLIKLTPPVSDTFKLYGLLGGSTVVSSARGLIPGLTVTSKAVSFTGFSFGAGFEYEYFRNSSIGVEWMRLLNSVNRGGEVMTLDGINIVLKYSF